MMCYCANRLTQVSALLLAWVVLMAGCTPASPRPAATNQADSSGPSQVSGPAGPAASTRTEQPPAVETPKPSSEAVPGPQVVPSDADLTLRFRPEQVTTYHLVTGWQRRVIVRNVVKGEVSEVPSASTGTAVEMIFSQSVQSVDPNGQALLGIAIQGLKVSTQQIGDPIIEFDSSRAEDANKPLAKLIGQSYRIRMGREGSVVQVLDVQQARMAVASSRAAEEGKAAARLLSDEAIRDRHTLSALATSGGGLHKSGQSWSQIRTVSFDALGSRSFEKVYTLKGVDKADGRPAAVIDMRGSLSSKGSQQAHGADDVANALAQAMDMTFTYRGECRLDLEAGQVERAGERLEVRWVAVDPRAKTGTTEGEPNSIVMMSTHIYEINRVAPTAVTQVSAQPLKPAPQGPEKTRFALRFQEGRALEYKFASRRDVQILWDPNRAAARPDPNNSSDMTESLDLVMVYKPVKVHPDGMASIEATFKSVTARRTQLGGGVDTRPDPVEGLRGKTFTWVVEPGGRIRDANSLDALLKEIGKASFREDAKNGRVKDPEMISDVVATQWFLWDAISSMDPHGVAVGQTWDSRLSLPTPMVMRQARDVTYRLDRLEQTPSGRVATFTSDFRWSDRPAPASWPIPYSGKMRVSGAFGFLGGYRPLTLEGKGQEQFDLEAGVSKGYDHQFHVEMQASGPPIGPHLNPKVVIRQTIKMERIN